jgi:hypothetical protein
MLSTKYRVSAVVFLPSNILTGASSSSSLVQSNPFLFHFAPGVAALFQSAQGLLEGLGHGAFVHHPAAQVHNLVDVLDPRGHSCSQAPQVVQDQISSSS